MLITIIIALLFPNSRLMLCSMFSYDFPKIRNLRKIFLRSFENLGPGPDFYRAMHFSAKRGIAIACRLSVRLSVCDVGEL